MIYLKKTFEYLFILGKGKRFLVLFLLSLPIGICLSFVSPIWAYTEWAANFTTGNFNFWEAWILAGYSDAFPYAAAILIVVAIGYISIQATIVSRSLRVGVFRVNRLMKEFNESFFPSLYAVLFYLLIYLAYKVLSTVFIILWQILNPVTLAFILSVFTMFLVFMFTMAVVALTTLFMPIMTISGVKPQAALLGSIHKCNKSVKGLMFSIGLPIIVVNVIGSLIGLLGIPLLSIIIESVLYSFLVCYLHAHTMISYYEIEQLKREDYTREYYFKR